MAKVQKSILVKSQIITFEKKTGETGLENKLIRDSQKAIPPAKVVYLECYFNHQEQHCHPKDF